MAGIVDETEEYVEFSVGACLVEEPGGGFNLTEDFVVNGEVWRIHKNDPDPLPSDPHAHCMSGKCAGLKLHLGTRELFDGSQPTGRRLGKGHFGKLIELAKSKFPDVTLPIPAAAS